MMDTLHNLNVTQNYKDKIMNITSAEYRKDLDGKNETIFAVIDGQEWFVPLDPENTHYAEILAQVKAGTLTIKDED
jgi:hypothetical protein